MSTLSEQDRKQIVAITVRIVAGMVEQRKVNPEDDEALRTATKEAAATAKAAYFAALDFLR